MAGNDHLLILTGHVWGNVPSSRTLFTYRVSAGEFKEALRVEESQSILDLALDGDEVRLTVAEYHNGFSDHAVETRSLDLAPLLEFEQSPGGRAP